MIVVCGEALIDLVPAAPGTEPADALLPRPGGSPFNVAIGLGRLGVDVAFLSRLSTDGFGRRLRGRLAAEGVDTRWTASGDEPTALAVVTVDAEGHPHYDFHWEATADRSLSDADLPDDLGTATALHFGSLSIVLPPACDAYAALLRREAERRVVSFDPNVRPGFLDAARIERIHALAATSHLVKVSAEDAALLGFARSAEAADRWLDAGAEVVVVTDGSRGATGWTAAGEVSVPAPAVAVVDTLGAGDAFTAGLLAALHDTGRLTPAAVGALSLGDLREALAYASRVAAVTCRRRGADPPTREQLAG